MTDDGIDRRVVLSLQHLAPALKRGRTGHTPIRFGGGRRESMNLSIGRILKNSSKTGQTPCKGLRVKESIRLGGGRRESMNLPVGRILKNSSVGEPVVHRV